MFLAFSPVWKSIEHWDRFEARFGSKNGFHFGLKIQTNFPRGRSRPIFESPKRSQEPTRRKPKNLLTFGSSKMSIKFHKNALDGSEPRPARGQRAVSARPTRGRRAYFWIPGPPGEVRRGISKLIIPSRDCLRKSCRLDKGS